MHNIFLTQGIHHFHSSPSPGYLGFPFSFTTHDTRIVLSHMDWRQSRAYIPPFSEFWISVSYLFHLSHRKGKLPSSILYLEVIMAILAGNLIFIPYLIPPSLVSSN